MTLRPENICVNSVSINFARMSISSCGVPLDLFSLSMYLVVQANGMMGAGFWCVTTLVYVASIQQYTLGVS